MSFEIYFYTLSWYYMYVHEKSSKNIKKTISGKWNLFFLKPHHNSHLVMYYLFFAPIPCCSLKWLYTQISLQDLPQEPLHYSNLNGRQLSGCWFHFGDEGLKHIENVKLSPSHLVGVSKCHDLDICIMTQDPFNASVSPDHWTPQKL